MSSTTTDTTDPQLIQYYIGMLRRFWVWHGPNFCDMIAANNGWLPLEPNEKMTIHYGDKEYLITRKK